VLLAQRLTPLELVAKAMEEKALEGRTPTRVRFDVRTMVYQPSEFGRSPCRFVFCPTASAVGAINDG
jgi:acid phosphatase class B